MAEVAILLLIYTDPVWNNWGLHLINILRNKNNKRNNVSRIACDVSDLWHCLETSLHHDMSKGVM